MELHVDSELRYAIRGPETDRTYVEFWMSKRLSFDNKRDWERDLVAELATRLLELSDTEADGSGELRWLQAVFASDDPIDCDAGNLCYLNVGTRPFKTLGHMISFERWYEVPEAPSRIVSQTGHQYYHRYSLNRSPEPKRWRKTKLLAAWEGVPCGSPTGGQAAREVWLAMRRRPQFVVLGGQSDSWSEIYGVSVRLRVPSRQLVMPAGILEAVVDGCLASFHRDDDHGRAAMVAAKLATQLHDTDEAELLSALTNPGGSLFAGPPFRRHPTFVQLSPCDERCLVGSLELVEDPSLAEPSLSGEIFALEAAR